MDTTELVNVFVKSTPPLPPIDLGHLLVVLLLFLDRVLAWVVLQLPLLGLGHLIQVIAQLVLNGVSWYETSPAVFWLVWLPGTVSAYVKMLFAVGRGSRRVAQWLWVGIFRHFVLGWLLEVVAAWFLRGGLAPPPVQRAEDVLDTSVTGVTLAHTRGIAYAQAAKVTHASVTSGGLTPSRVRGRAVWVNRLQHYLRGRPGTVGNLIRGRWVPDLPNSQLPLSANALLGLADQELKLLGGGVLPTTVTEHEVFLVVETNDGRRVVAPALLAKLSLYACFRPRTQELLAGLRSRAREWFSEKGVADLASAFVLPDTVELAFHETAPERLARGRLDVVEESTCL